MKNKHIISTDELNQFIRKHEVPKPPNPAVLRVNFQF